MIRAAPYSSLSLGYTNSSHCESALMLVPVRQQCMTQVSTRQPRSSLPLQPVNRGGWPEFRGAAGWGLWQCCWAKQIREWPRPATNGAPADGSSVLPQPASVEGAAADLREPVLRGRCCLPIPVAAPADSSPVGCQSTSEPVTATHCLERESSDRNAAGFVPLTPASGRAVVSNCAGVTQTPADRTESGEVRWRRAHVRVAVPAYWRPVRESQRTGMVRAAAYHCKTLPNWSS